LPALQIQTVLDETTVKKRRKALKTMPKELHEAYGGIIERIGRQPKGKVHQAMEVLKWAFLSERPLSTIELRHALSVTPEDTDFDIEDLPTESSLLNCCLGLVTIVIEDEVPTIRLVHKSLQEYLEANQQAFFRNGHREITVTCLTYMSFASTVDFQGLTFLEILDRLEFLEYASLWWTYHVKEQDLDQEAEDLAIKVLERGFYLPGYREEDFKSGMWDYFITKPAAGSDNWRYSAMHAATQFDSEKPLQLLMKNRICLGDLNCGNSFGYTPLSTAVRMCRPEAVRILLQNSDTDVNAKNEFGSTPLHLAAEIHENDDEKLQITRLLLERPDIDINSKGKHGNTPLHIAAEGQYSGILQLLLETPEININIQDESGRTPLHNAACNSTVPEFARILLERPEIDVNVRDAIGETPFHVAMWNGNDDIAELLFKRTELDIASNNLSEQKSPSSPNTVTDHSRTEEAVDSGTNCENGGTYLENAEDMALRDKTELNEVEADIGKRDDLVKTDLEEEDNEDVWEDALEC
jgi:ankyrin repeat protein